jgi:tetrathionate reductase subunit B
MTAQLQTRRAFLKGAAGAAAAAALCRPVVIAIAAEQPGEGSPRQDEDGEQHAYAFVVDVGKCIGCGNCVQACGEENHVPEGVTRTWVERYAITDEGVLVESIDQEPEHGFGPVPPEVAEETRHTAFVPKLCNHCENAPCVQVCPVGATFHAPGGFVLVDPEHCIGCGYCIQACPYGVRFLNPQTRMADKCTWCYHRVVEGLQPACVTVCPTGAREFGDLNDPQSAPSRVRAENRWRVLKPAMHTESLVMYLNLPREVV